MLPEKPVLPKGRYRHYKGGEYEVVDLALHSEAEEWLVIYRPLYGDGHLWARPYNMFFEEGKFEGKWQPRFQRIDDT